MMRERDILDALHGKFCRIDTLGSRRYVVAEHVGLEPLFPRRRLDFVTLDTWGSTGYALDGFEIKTSRSDLQRELRDPSKAAAFTDHLDTFTLVVAADVSLDHLAIPDAWGIMVCSPSGTLRYRRRPTRLSASATYGMSAALTRHVVAGFARAAQKTALRVCAHETSH